MKCIRCNNETIGSMKVCFKCLSDWENMRSMIWEHNVKKYGKFSPATDKNFKEETRRLERIWRKDKKDFYNEITQE